VSIFQDSLNVITFHIHCFYAYARRLFLSQSHGLLSLWRLFRYTLLSFMTQALSNKLSQFRGKKYNPLRDRVDSSSNDVDQVNFFYHFVDGREIKCNSFLFSFSSAQLLSQFFCSYFLHHWYYYCVFKGLDLILNRLHATLSLLVSFTIDLAGEGAIVCEDTK